jgi:CheY-like chemotaxis protein
MDNAETLRILHLEDNPVDAELVLEALQSGGIHCNISRLTTRAELEASLKAKPDLILSDSSLPGFDTLEALAVTHLKDPALPFVFVSGSCKAEVRQTALERGANAYVSKNELSKLVDWIKKYRSTKAAETKRLPPTGRMVIAQCKDFRCLAYLDNEGSWRDYHSRQVLPEVTNWYDV